MPKKQKTIKEEMMEILEEFSEDIETGVLETWIENYATQITNLFRERDIPMGVSQWRNHGQKWGYWEFWEKEIKENVRNLFRAKNQTANPN
jgi:hypothetical protein